MPIERIILAYYWSTGMAGS